MIGRTYVPTRVRHLLVLLFFLFAIACSGGGSNTSPQVTKPGDPALLVNPTSLAFTAVGQTQTIFAQENLNSNPFTATTSNALIATVSPSSSYGSFTVTAVKAGTVTITVSDSGTQHVTVSVGVTTTSGGIN